MTLINDIAEFERQLKHNSALLEKPDGNGCSPLLQACSGINMLEMVIFLLDHGANISSKDSSWGWGALHYAVWKNNVGN